MAPKKQAMSAAERKRKSRMNKLKAMSEEEEKCYKEKEKERVRKAMQNKRINEREQMTPNELKMFKESEAARIKALRNKKKDLISKAKEKQKKEAAAAMLKMTASSRQNPYKTRQSFSKAINKVRTELPFSPRKQAVVVEGLASEFGYQVNTLRNMPDNPNKDKIKQFYYRSDIVYTMPGKGDEITIWNEGKQKLRKYYLTMYLKEAYALYLETCENDSEKCSLSTFCNLRPKNVLLLGDSPKEQCKCQIHENLFLKLEALGYDYESSWWETVLCDISPNSPCWKNTCIECKDGKKVIPRKALNAMTTYNQWNTIEVPNQSKNKLDTDADETYKKIAIVMKEVRVGEVLDELQESFAKVKEHQNIKRIQASEFQKDLVNESVRVLQIDYAMAYQCELQKETMGALWTRGSVNLFTCAIYHKGETKTMMFCTNYKGKDKFSTGLFLDMIYNDYILPYEDIQTEVIWSDGPSSEFKNQYMRFLIQELSKKHGKPFIWKFSATSHGKGVVDGVGGKVKSSVHKKVMSLGKDRPIVQDSESFAKLAKELSESTTIVHVSKEEVNAYKDSNPFSKSIPVHGISKMHVMKSDGTSSYLWSNSSYHQSGTKANIQLPLP